MSVVRVCLHPNESIASRPGGLSYGMLAGETRSDARMASEGPALRATCQIFCVG